MDRGNKIKNNPIDEYCSEQVSESLESIIANLEPTDTINKLEELGIQIKKEDGSFRDTIEILQAVYDAIEKADSHVQQR